MIILRTNAPYWRNKNQWVCPNHLPCAVIPARVSQCYFSNCNSIRPSTRKALKERAEEAQKRLEKEKSIKCNMEGCNKPVASNRSKYCSDDCRKKYARKQYNIRMKIKRGKK